MMTSKMGMTKSEQLHDWYYKGYMLIQARVDGCGIQRPVCIRSALPGVLKVLWASMLTAVASENSRQSSKRPRRC
jgi:hypothetical protein